jgi:hypothetical protein
MGFMPARSPLRSPALRRVAAACAGAVLCTTLGGCGVIVLAGTAASLAVDATVGAVKLTGKAVGAAVDVVTPGGDEKK